MILSTLKLNFLLTVTQVATGLLILSMLAFTSVSFAEPNEFAEQKVVLQISDSDPFKQTLVLNVANNLIKHYGPDQVQLEIVAFGPGLRLLFKENSNDKRIQSLSTSGVTFSACSNTIDAMTKQLGSSIVLNEHAVTVSAGVVRILDLEQQGYNLVKP